jgi:hypothetical protein
VGGSALHVLRLVEDAPRVVLDELRGGPAHPGGRLGSGGRSHAHGVPGAAAVAGDVAAILALAERNLRGG